MLKKVIWFSSLIGVLSFTSKEMADETITNQE